MPLLPRYAPMAYFPMVKSSAVTTAPMKTSRQAMRTLGNTL